jgi:hypothetical protein
MMAHKHDERSGGCPDARAWGVAIVVVAIVTAIWIVIAVTVSK